MAKHNLKAVVIGVSHTWTVDCEASNLVIEAARKGYQEWLQDAASTAKATDGECNADVRLLDGDTPDGMTAAEYRKTAKYKGYLAAMEPIRKRAMADRNKRIQDGSYRPGQGGGGGRQLTAEIRGWVTYFNTMGIKESGDKISGKNVEIAQKGMCRRWILDQYEAGKEKDEVSRNMKDHIKKRFAEFIADREANDPIIEAMIKAEKDMDAAKAMANSMGG